MWENIQKKGQVTLFIILGIVILLICAGVLFYIRQTNSSPNHKTTHESTIQGYVQGCVELTSEMALLSIARKAGYGEASEYMETKNFRAP